jgi:cyclic pyranopterin phosphate synthase
MIMTFFLPATVLRSEGLWPRISVGQRFASMVRSFRALLHVVKLTRHAKRLHYRPDPTHPLVGTIVPATAASDLAPLTPPTPLIDPFGRTVTYLRVSVTDRCDFRCVYCMSEDMTFLPKRDLLTLEELDRVCTAFVEKGVRKLRITGGEPLVRRDIMRLFGSLSRHLHTGALNELTVTTNGSQLARHAGDLAGYGVRRINVSLDTLDPDKFKRITRWGDFSKVMDGIDAAQGHGMHVKINAVALKNVNDDEIETMIEWAHGRGMDMTLIEVMPLGEMEVARVDQFLPLSVVRARLLDRYTLEDLPDRTGGPARYVRVKETGGRLGFITPLTHNFCEACNRVRLTCTGKLYMCLGQEDAADLRTPLRLSEGNERLNQTIEDAIARKPKGHDFVIDRRNRPAVGRHMSVTGG